MVSAGSLGRAQTGPEDKSIFPSKPAGCFFPPHLRRNPAFGGTQDAKLSALVPEPSDVLFFRLPARQRGDQGEGIVFSEDGFLCGAFSVDEDKTYFPVI